MVAAEKSFPRGGTVDGESPAAGIKPNLFSHKPRKSKSKKKLKHHVVTGAEPKLLSLEDLSYKVLSEGMLVLVQVTEITDYHLHVSMPGLTVGRVPITQISEPYSLLLQSMSRSDDNLEALCPLSELFYKGQLLPAQVWQIRKTSDNRHMVSLSLDPRNVHSEWSHVAMAKKGLIVTAAVKSKEEHGYVMDCGVNGLRSFLKEEKVRYYSEIFNGGRPLAIGQLVPCVVTKAEKTAVASKIELSADPDDVGNQEEVGYPCIDLQQLLPGMRFQLDVTDPLRDGLKVKFYNFTGYVHRNHVSIEGMQDGLASLYPPGSSLFGRVLYVTPLTKSIYLSALPNVTNIVKEIPKPSSAEVALKIGDIIDSAKVIGVGKRGVFLQLGKKRLNIQGFVPERRIGFNYKGKVEDDDDEVTMLQRLRNKFPLGSSVQCRLLHFDSLSRIYVCSMEKSILTEKYLTFSDVHVGDVIPCIVENICKGGIIVRVGMLSGFVPATHSADLPLHQPVKKFPSGTRVSGRVLKVDSDKRRLIVTLKQSLVTCLEPIITSYQSARKGVPYLGTVVAITSKGVYVSFFGGVRGFLESNKYKVPESQKFFLGQLVTCYVTRRNDKQIRLSLMPPSGFKIDQAACKAVRVGQAYKLEVVSVGSTGLGVKIIDDGNCFNATGVIPTSHLSDNLQMSQLLLHTFEIGTVLTNVWCYSNSGTKHPIVFSMRSSVVQFFKSTEGIIANKKTLEAVSPGWVLPCTLKKIDPSYILLQVPLNSVPGLVKVSHEYICNQDETIPSLGLVEGQGIQAKVLHVLASKNTLLLGCRKNQVWDGELETCILHLFKYLSDQKRLLNHARKVGNPIGSYSVGTEVSALVSNKTEWGYVFTLSDGTRGEATFYNAGSDQLSIGASVKGKVLHVDCVRNHVEITLRRDICSVLKKNVTVDEEPTVDVDVQLRGPTLLVTPEFVLVLLKGAGKMKFGYIPTHLYPFSCSALSIVEPFFGIDRKVVVKKCSNGIVVCLPKEVIINKKKEDKKKQKLKERKAAKKIRYFRDDSDIKKEEPEEMQDDDDDDDDDLNGESGAILDPRNDVKIIDEGMDDISDEDSDVAVDLGDSDSETESQGTIPSDSRKRKLSTHARSMTDEDELLSEKARKRKSSDSSDVDDTSSSASKKQRHEEDMDNNFTLKKSKKKERCFEVISLVEEIDAQSSEKTSRKRKNQKSTEAVKETGKVASDSEGIEESDSVSHSNETDCKPTLKSPGFLWDIDPTKFMQVLEPTKNETSSDEDPDNDGDEASKKKKRKKSAAERREALRAEEERLQKVEKELLDPNRQLSSCDDFDRMVLSNPDSSAIWLQYMAFHLQATEIEKARAVAQRALKSISYREEQEKLNVWLGLLNLENLYGTTESLRTTLDQALQANDPYKVRAHMVKIYAENGKSKELDSEVRLVVKKFKETPGMWQEVGQILMNNGFAEKARLLLQQALPHMKSKKDSVGLVVQFALMEARCSNIEQAKALMDPILASYPQRTDVWCTYCDMLVKANQISEARELLERSVCLKLPARKMKTLYSKFLQFEEAHGSQEGAERVRALAAEFVKQVSGEELVDEA